MGFWLATLNPGRKARSRRGKKRRTLTAWQKAVKRHGGVMQAVKARRKRSRRGGRRRRNPFLSTALTSGGALVGMNGGRKRRVRRNKTRRPVSLRVSRSRRSRKASSRRSQMARKTRRRRMPSRGRGGRFVSRRSGGRRRKSRRTRRNPVLPISWNGSRRRRKSSRRRRSRRNPLFLSRRGFSPRKHKGYRRLRMRRSSPRHWHNNPIAANLRRRRSRRSYRRNPVLPISWNPARALGLGGAPGQVLGRLTSFIDVKFWTETGIPAAAGFFGSKAAGGFVLDMVSKAWVPPANLAPYLKMAADALAGSGIAYALGRFYSKQAADSFWLGTVVNVAHSVLKQLFGDTEIAKKIGLSGLGDDIAERMKEAIAQRVNGALNGMGSYLRTTNLRGLNEYVTENDLRGRSSFSATPGSNLRDYDPTDQTDA